MTDSGVTIEESVVEESVDDEIPPLENTPPGDAGAPGEEKLGGEGEDKRGPKQSKSEKKSRKAVAKLGLKPVPGVVRVTVKKAKNILFVISKPDVFKSPASDTYVIFGEANIEDPGSHLLKETAKQFEKKRQDAAGNGDEPPALEPVEAPEAVDETGVEEKDIELVMSQTSATRSQAVAALKKTGGDIVNAIMELTL